MPKYWRKLPTTAMESQPCYLCGVFMITHVDFVITKKIRLPEVSYTTVGVCNPSNKKVYLLINFRYTERDCAMKLLTRDFINYLVLNQNPQYYSRSMLANTAEASRMPLHAPPLGHALREMVNDLIGID